MAMDARPDRGDQLSLDEAYGGLRIAAAIAKRQAKKSGWLGYRSEAGANSRCFLPPPGRAMLMVHGFTLFNVVVIGLIW